MLYAHRMSLSIDANKLKASCAPVAKALSTFPVKQARLSNRTLRQFASAAETLEELVEQIEPGEQFEAFGILLLAKSALTTKPAALTITPKGKGRLKGLPEVGEVRFHHGDLTVNGDLTLDLDLMVTGDLKVSGTVTFDSEYACLYVGGNMSAKALSSWGKTAVTVGGALRVSDIINVVEGFVNVGSLLEARLVLESSIGGAVSAQKKQVAHWFTQKDLFSRARPSLQKLRAILTPEVFSAKDEDEDTFSFVSRTFTRLAANKPIWNSAKKKAPAKKKALAKK